ncbi:MAG: hypothetical protein Q7J20_12080, partial [Candidatus Nitrotoga sp.]|nr:hypothetical protein [Candidatus Nitrotoga sp.]
SLSVVGTTLRKITAWADTLTGKANQVMTTSIGRGFLTLNKQPSSNLIGDSKPISCTKSVLNAKFNNPPNPNNPQNQN